MNVDRICEVTANPRWPAVPQRMGDVEKAFAAGANDYLVKRFDSRRLFAKIDKVLAMP